MTPNSGRSTTRAVLVLAAALAMIAALLSAQRAAADHTPLPDTVALVGSLQSELGCPGDWQPECDATELQPVAGQPHLFRATFTVPAGSFEYKVALNESWDENYGAGGQAGGANIPLNAPGGEITFTYDHNTHLITDSLPKPLIADHAAQWLRRDTIAWNLPEERAGFSYRLYWADEGGLTNTDGTITGGSSAALTLTGGLPAALIRQYPHLAAYEALQVPRSVRAELPSILTGEIAVASFDAAGDLVAVTGVQLPGVLDDLYRGAQRRNARPGLEWRSADSGSVGADGQVRRPAVDPGRLHD